MRAQFFGNEGTTRPVVEELISTLPRYRHHAMDIVTDKAYAICSDKSDRISSSTPQPSLLTTKQP